MNNIQLQKQQYREFHRSLQADGELVTIQYRMRRPGVTSDTWAEADGIIWRIDNILALHKVVTPLTFSDGSVTNTIISKGDFFIPYAGLDFYGVSKKFFKIIDQTGQVFDIDKVVPCVKYGNGFLSWKFMQK